MNGVNRKIRGASNCGVVYSGACLLHRSSGRNNNKNGSKAMQGRKRAKWSERGRERERGGLVTEGMMY